MKKIIPLVLSAILMTVSIILMIFLKSVVMKFADTPNQFIYRFYSYIDAMVFGYGNWLPIISLIFACVSLIFIVKAMILYMKSRRPKNTSIIFAAISIVASLLSILMFWSMNVESVLIVSALAISILFQYIGYKILQI